ncbi:MAG: hypothetical protein H0W37_12405 [Pseudonocardiales bacterium]|nr:hypothetical protein [Pseudonocardiales bacterium]
MKKAALDVRFENNPPRPASGDVQMEADGAVQCYKCWVDTETGAWICLPTAC